MNLAPHGILFLATLTTSLAAQQPRFLGSLDGASPDLGLGRSAADMLDLNQAACNLTPAFQARDLGVPQGGNVDAISNGFDVFTAKGPVDGQGGGRSVVGMFSVDRTSQGNGGAVRNQAQGNGASCDVFQVALLPFVQPVQVMLDARCVDGRQSNVDGLVGDARYPVYFSIDAPTAQAMNVSPADILWVSAAGAVPRVFLPRQQLGLLPGDDIDALALGAEGVLFSLTRVSPTAQASPLMGGAGVFTTGGTYWATAAQMGLDPRDELDALMMFDPSPIGFELRHTLLVAGQPGIFRIDGALPGEPRFLFASFRGINPVCVFGLCLDILPDHLLGVLPPADPLGSSSLLLPIPPGVEGLELATQALVPRGAIGPAWAVSNPILGAVEDPIVTVVLTRNAAANGYNLTSAHGVDVVNFVNVTGPGGALNGDHRVTITGAQRPTACLAAGRRRDVHQRQCVVGAGRRRRHDRDHVGARLRRLTAWHGARCAVRGGQTAKPLHRPAA